MRKKVRMTIGAFNLIKGIGMLIIVAGHIYGKNTIQIMPVRWILKIVGMGLMPMFFVISGFGCKKTSLYSYGKKAAKGLLLPYLYTAIAVAIVFPIVHYISFRWWPGAMSESGRVILAFLSGCPKAGKELFGISLYECTPLWYFLAMFWGMAFVTVLLHIESKEKRSAGALGISAVGYFLATKDIFWYWCIPQGMMVTGYLYTGYCMKKTRWLEKNISVKAAVCLGILAVMELYFGEMNLSYVVFKRGFVDYIGGGILGIVTIRIGLYLNRFTNKGLEMLRKVGRYTYQIICIHAVETNCVPWYLLSEKMQGNPYGEMVIEIVLRFLFIGSICFILNIILKEKRQKEMRQRLCMSRNG